MYKYLLCLLMSLPGSIAAQNLTGTWVGDEGRGTFLKLVIVHIGDSCYGYTYDEGGGGYCRANFAGRVSGRKQQLRGSGFQMIEGTKDHELANYQLGYRKIDGQDYLIGPISGQSFLTNILNIATVATATLRRESEAVDSTPFIMAVLRRYEKQIMGDSLPRPVNADIAAVAPASPAAPIIDTLVQKTLPPVVETNTLKEARKTKTIQSITTSADTLRMTLFDNGVMDHDTVTVFFDNKILLNQALITVKGQTIDIPLPKDGQPHQIILFANNLGSIPPNTAFLVIYAGEQRYELRAAFDLQTNAAITVRYAK